MNHSDVVYIGSYDSVGKEWTNGRRFVFKNGTPTKVPDEFAAILTMKREFVYLHEMAILTNKYRIGGLMLMRRWGALGDLMVFRAAVSAFRRRHPQYFMVLQCQEHFVPIFQNDRLWQDVIPLGPINEKDYAGILSFDQVAEADHRGFESMHRADLFIAAMTQENLKLTREDWMLPIPQQTVDWVEKWMLAHQLKNRSRKLLALQIRGSGKMKSMPEGVMRALLQRLLDLDVEVLLIEPDFELAKMFLINDRVHEMSKRDALATIQALKSVDLAISFDSGALWMSHCAPCPVLCIMGPTRPAQRISYHPLYPDGARAVCLNEIINCPACFESSKACGGIFKCMQEQPDWDVALDRIMQAVRSMLAGEPAPVSEAPAPINLSQVQIAAAPIK